MVWLAMQAKPEFTWDFAKAASPSVDRGGLLVESIDESFTALLGQNVKDAIYAHLAKRTLDREEIPERLDEFDECLQETFGRAAPLIERNILTRYYRKLGLNFSGTRGYAFPDFVDATRKSIQAL